MKSKAQLTLCAALPIVLGAGAALYHSRLVSACTDPATGQIINGMSGTLTPFFIAAGGCAVVFLLMALWGRRTGLQFGLRRADTAGKTVRVCAAMLLFVAAALTLLQSGQITLIVILKGVFLAACGVSAIAFVKADSLMSKGMCSLFPLFFVSIYLLGFYRDSARNPLTGTYAFEILSIIALMLALYLSSAVWFDKKRPIGLLFFAMSATFGYFCSLLGALLSVNFAAHYLPVGLADALLCPSLLLLVWCDIFDAVRPLPLQPQDEEAAPESGEK